MDLATNNPLTNANGSNPAFAPSPGQGTQELERIQPEIVETWQCGVHLLTIDLLLTNLAFVMGTKSRAEAQLIEPLTGSLISYFRRPLRLFETEQEIGVPAPQAARVYHTVEIVRIFDAFLNDSLLAAQ